MSARDPDRRRPALFIHNGRVITPLRTLRDGAVLIEDGRIRAVGATGEIRPLPGAQAIDARGNYVAPGFIEGHVHGGGGGDVMAGTVEDVVTCAVAHARGGVTRLLPTTLTAPIEAIRRALESIEKARKLDYPGAKIAGAHLEGPYINPGRAGAQNPRFAKNPDLDELTAILDRFPFVRRVSLAPELPGALEVAQELRRRGIIASIAHTEATFDEVVRAVECGFTHATHVFNAMSTVHRAGTRKAAGAAEAALALDELTTEVICDGHHVPAGMLRLLIQAKGAHRVALTTDAISAAGCGPGRYSLMGLDVVVTEERPGELSGAFVDPPPPCRYVARLIGKDILAGSVATMNLALRTAVELAGVTVEEAVKMATLVPARIHGLDRQCGILSPGMLGDVVIFDPEFRILATVVEGRLVYSADPLGGAI